MPEKNRIGLINYLAKHDIDANLIPEDKIDADGYEERQYQPDGRPIYSEGFVVKTVRKSWPNKTVFENVLVLLAGGNEKDLKAEPKTKAPAKEKTDD